MNQPLNLRIHLIKTKNLEVKITFLLFLYYLGLNLPNSIIQGWAVFGFIAVTFLIIGCWKRFFWVITKDILLFILIIIVPVSIFWSNSPESTLAYSRAFLCSTAFGIYLATRYTPKEQMQLITWLLGIFTCVSFIVPLILPSYGINYNYAEGPAWVGVSRYKNDLSAIMAIAATLFLDISIYVPRYRYRWATLSVTILAFLLLVLSKGKGSLGILIGLLPLLPLYKIVKQEYRLRTVLSICAIMIGGFIIVAILGNLDFIVTDFLGKDIDGNGRKELWTYLIERGLEKPWLGYGYAGFWNDPSEGLGVALKFPWITGAGDGGGNAHSSYVEVFLQLGWLGVLLITLSFLTVLIRVVFLLGLTRQIEFFWMLQYLLILAIASFSDSVSVGFISYRSLFWVLYVAIAYSTAIQINRIKY